MPENLKKVCKKVFSKHTVKEIREWTRNLNDTYHLLYGQEKPMDLSMVRPFANTTNLTQRTPTLHDP